MSGAGAGGADRAALLARIRAALRTQSGNVGDDSDVSDLPATAFSEVPQSAYDALAARLDGNAGNGQAISDLFADAGSDAANRAAVVMLNGLSQGPMAIAQNLAQVLGMSQNRAETIARNELVSSYRDAQMANYRANSDVVGQWIWSAAVASACIMCIDMDGTIHNMDEDLLDHVCGRCEPLPVTKSWDDILSPYGISAAGIPETSITQSYGTGRDWFVSQNEATQIGILGPAKYEAWMRGDLSLDDLVGVRSGGAWGDSLYERSLKELGLDARDYLPQRPLTGLGRQGRRAIEEADLRQAAMRARGGEGLGPQGIAAIRGAERTATELDMVKVDMGNGMFTYVLRDDASQFDLGSGARNVEADMAHWQNIDDVLAGLRGETGETAAAVEEAERELPEIPAAHIAEAHAQQMNMVDEWAKLRNMTPEQYEAAVSAHIQDMLKDADLSVRAPADALENILNDGRFKSVFESGRSGTSAGRNVEEYKNIRAGYEAKVFGEGDHPIYGYLADAGTDVSSAEGFGEARVFFNDDVRDRTTFTFGDSLDSPVVPRPLESPEWDAFAYVNRPEGETFGITISPEQWAQRFDPLNFKSLTQFGNDVPLGYVETQIHGPLSVGDIARVEFDKAPNKALQDKLEQAGINWSVKGEATEATGAAVEADHLELSEADKQTLLDHAEALQSGTVADIRGEVREASLNGQDYIIKASSEQGIAQAQVTYDLAERLGMQEYYLPATSVERDGQQYLIQPKVAGTRVDQLAPGEVARALTTDEQVKVGLFDYVLGNGDASGYNAFLMADGRYVHIDTDDLFQDYHTTPDQFNAALGVNSFAGAEGEAVRALSVPNDVLTWLREEVVPQRGAIEQRILDAFSARGQFAHLDAATEARAMAASEIRLDALQQLAAMPHPTLGDLNALASTPETDQRFQQLASTLYERLQAGQPIDDLLHGSETVAQEATAAATTAAATAAEPTVSFATDAVQTRLMDRLDNPTDAEFARLMGAQPGDTVEVDKYGQVYVRGDGYQATRWVVSPDAETGDVGIRIQQYATPDGTPLPVDNRFAALLRTQVQQAQDGAGGDALTYLHIKARPDTSDYESLLSLGFDAPIDMHVLTEAQAAGLPPLLPGEFAEKFPGVQTLGELVSTPEGREWWHVNGMNPDLTFNLRDGSVSIERLNAYLRAHGMEEVS